MPRKPAPSAETGRPSKGFAPLTASARLIKFGDKSEARRIIERRKEWQTTALDYAEVVPEVGNVATNLGSAVSALRLYVGVTPETRDAPPVDLGNPEALERAEIEVPQDLIDEATAVFDALGAGDVSLSDMQRDIAINWELTGEGYLAEMDYGWDFLSIDELRVSKEGKYSLREYPGDKGRPLENDPIRMWVPDARYGALAYSPMRGVLDLCEELLILTRAVRAAGVSLIAGNGVLIVPKNVVAGWGTRQNAGNGEERENPFVDDLLQYMMTPIQDEGAASASVPLVLFVDREDAEMIRHMPLSNPLDQYLDQRTKTTIGRIGTGLDMPAESLEDVSHWVGWLLDDQQFSRYVRPMGERMCTSLTVGYQRPRMTPRTNFDLRRIAIWYDASDVVVRPNRAQDAKDAQKAGAIGREALRRYLAFEESDAPTDEDMEVLLSLNGQAPDTVGNPGSGGGSNDNGESNGSTPVTSAASPQRVNIGTRLAELDRSLRDRLQTSCDAAMRRALERAGSRVRSKAQKDPAASAVAASAAVDRIPSLLGPALVAALGLTDDALLEGEFDQIEDSYETWTERTQRAAFLALGLAWTDGEEQRAREDRHAGWVLLLAGLMAAARIRLYDPTPQAPEFGEFDPLNLVPPSVVRSSMARAGGQIVDASERFTQPPMGVATGPSVLSVAADNGFETAGYVWDWGGAAHPFEPHLNLNGVEFDNFDDPVLANSGGWPFDVAHYFPGDHLFCSCSATPNVVQVAA